MIGIFFFCRRGRNTAKQRFLSMSDILFVRGESGARGAPTICLNKKIAHYFGEARFGSDFVAARLDLVPPVVLWAFHGPTGQFSEDTYADSLCAIWLKL